MHWNVFNLEIAGNHSIRQAQTQLNILNFHRYDNNILNPRTNVLDKNLEPSIRRYEIPIMQWSIAQTFAVTGESLTITRWIMFLIGLSAIGGLFLLLQLIFKDLRVSMAGAWAFNFSPVFYFYTMNPMPDMLALASSIWSLVFFFRFLKTQYLLHAALSSLLISLAAAAKLPYIVFLAAPGIWWLEQLIKKKSFRRNRLLYFAVIYFIALVPTLLWYVWVIPGWTNGLLTGIVTNPVTSEQFKEYMSFHISKMFPQILLGYISIAFVLTGIFFFIRNKLWKEHQSPYLMAAGVSVIFYWIYEFNGIGYVHDYYMLPFLPLLYLLAAGGIKYLLKFRAGKYITLFLLACIPFTTFLLAKDYWSNKNAWILRDVFIHQEDLKNAVPDDALCIFLNDPSEQVFMYLMDKKGMVFRDDNLPGPWVDDMVRNSGFSYMYSDSRKVDTDSSVVPYLKELILERGQVKVFKLAVPY